MRPTDGTSGPRRQPLSLRRLQLEARQWRQGNFPDQQPWESLLGAVEELGELAHAHLKSHQSIDTGRDHDHARRDAVGDIIIFLAQYCDLMGLDLQEAVEAAWGEVRQRDPRRRTPARGSRSDEQAS